MPRLLAMLMSLAALVARAHTLPISYLTLVPGADYLHVELTLNPFELNSFSELDRNRNARIDSDELRATAKKVSQQILGALTLRVNGKPVAAEIAGIEPEADSHHLTLRGQYRVDARRARLSVESRLFSVLSMSHLTQVTVLRNERHEFAQLDAHSAKAEFGGSSGEASVKPARNDSFAQFLPLLGLVVLIWAMLAAALLLVIHHQVQRTRGSQDLKPSTLS